MTAGFGEILMWGALMANSGTDALLLGDAGYGVAPWLMTPFKEPLQSPQKTLYNIYMSQEGASNH